MRDLYRNLLLSIIPLVACSASRNLVEDVVIKLGTTRPEGVHALTAQQALQLGLPEAPHLLTTDLAFGGIKTVNLETQEVNQKVPLDDFGARFGVSLHSSGEYILMTSAAGKVFYIIEGTTGEFLATCAPEGAVLPMDIAIVDGKAYVTDAGVNMLWTVDLSTVDASLCNVEGIPLPAEWFSPSASSNIMANGVAEYDNGFFISSTTPGAIYYFDLDSMTASEVLPPGTISSAFGLALASDEDGTKLYVVQNDLWQVSVFDVTEGPQVELLGYIQSIGYDQPARASILNDFIYTPNTRLYSLPLPREGEEDPVSFNETFTVTGVDRFSYTKEPLLYPNDPPVSSPAFVAAFESSAFRPEALLVAFLAGTALLLVGS